MVRGLPLAAGAGAPAVASAVAGRAGPFAASRALALVTAFLGGIAHGSFSFHDNPKPRSAVRSQGSFQSGARTSKISLRVGPRTVGPTCRTPESESVMCLARVRGGRGTDSTAIWPGLTRITWLPVCRSRRQPARRNARTARSPEMAGSDTLGYVHFNFANLHGQRKIVCLASGEAASDRLS